MKWFMNLKLASKLAIAFLLLIVSIGFVGSFSLVQLSSVNDCSSEIAKRWMPSVRLAATLRSDILEYRMAVVQHIQGTTAEEMERFAQNRARAAEGLKANCAEFEPIPTTPEEERLYKEFLETWESYCKAADKTIQLSSSGQKDEAREFAAGEPRILYMKALDQLTGIIDINREGGQAASVRAADVYASSRFWIVSVIVTVVITGVTLAVVISKIISNPVKTLTRVADALAIGDVEQKIELNTKDELGLLADSFRKMVDAQKELATAATAISAGDMSTDVKVRSDKDVLSKSFVQLQKAISGLIAETNVVAQAAKEGQLSKRGNAAQFQGAYRQLVQGFNDTLDAVIEPVKESAIVLEKVAARDLTVRVEGDYKGEHALIKNALNTAVENLEEALSQAAVGSEQVTSAATQIAQGSQSLAQGASEQASSLEEISSSLEEMASMTKQNADNSNQGKLLAGEASEAAQRGNEAMGRMAEAIDKIKASSDATAKIIKTIDEIAFQTNLLALNAAVEAARAGEAGKGFAVVAEEVRNLAQRSAEAAKNTANMIEESVKNAEGGVRITEEVAKLLVEIGEGNRKVNDLVAEIAAASNEQSKGIEQVNLAVTQLDKVTQQNAANSEESASAAEELNSQALSLSQTVGQFKIASQGSTARPAPVVASTTTKPVVNKPAKNGHAPRKLVGAGANGKSKASRFLPLDEEDFQGF